MLTMHDESRTSNDELREFAKLVSEMRHWQREFSRSRSQEALRKSRQMENSVDKRLSEIFSPCRELFLF
jgi:hypothetical protein